MCLQVLCLYNLSCFKPRCQVQCWHWLICLRQVHAVSLKQRLNTVLIEPLLILIAAQVQQLTGLACNLAWTVDAAMRTYGAKGTHSFENTPSTRSSVEICRRSERAGVTSSAIAVVQSVTSRLGLLGRQSHWEGNTLSHYMWCDDLR